MLTIINQSPWRAALYSGWDQKGNYQMTCVIKASFHFDLAGTVIPMNVADPIVEGDHYQGTGIKSFLVQANEIMPFKKGGEWLLSGTCVPPHADCRIMQVSVGIASEKNQNYRKVLTVFGERIWRSTLLGNVISAPQHLKSLLLSYQVAYGGTDPKNPDKFNSFNPVGLGYTQSQWQIKGIRLPQLEIGPKFISAITDRPLPAGFGPIPLFWEPRLSRIPRVENESVYSPHGKNASDDLYNVAPDDQQFLTPFEGGEKISLSGLFNDHGKLITFNLPALDPIIYLASVPLHRLHGVTDTLCIDTDHYKFHLIHRVGIPWDMYADRTESVMVNE